MDKSENYHAANERGYSRQTGFSVLIRVHPPAPGARSALGWCEIQTNDVDGTIRTLIERGVSLNRMNMRSWSLEDLFIALTGKGLRS